MQWAFREVEEDEWVKISALEQVYVWYLEILLEAIYFSVFNDFHSCLEEKFRGKL